METVTSKDNKWLSSKDFSLTMLEIFSGCSLLPTCCKRLDNDMKSNATRKADFQSDYAQSFLAQHTFDCIHLSLVYSTYSCMAGNTL